MDLTEVEINTLEQVYLRMFEEKNIPEKLAEKFRVVTDKFRDGDEKTKLLQQFQVYMEEHGNNLEEEEEDKDDSDARNSLNSIAHMALTSLKLAVFTYTVYEFSRSNNLKLKLGYEVGPDGSMRFNLDLDKTKNNEDRN